MQKLLCLILALLMLLSLSAPALAEASASTENAVPGTIVASKGQDLIVKCNDGFLKIVELQFAGGKRLNARDVAHNYKPGQTFA